MYKLPPKLESFVPYEPLTGDYPVRLDVNESFVQVAPDVIAKAVARVATNRYPDPNAAEAVAAFARLFEVSPECVVAGNGSDELIGLICAGLLEKGGKVGVYTPDFSMYSFYAKLYELEVVDANTQEWDCLIFSNPCNPTSLGREKEEVLRLIHENPDKLIIVDEAYMDFWNEAHSLLCEVKNYNNLIVLRTCSKSVGLAGIRLGFAVANPTIINALRAVKSPFNVNGITAAIGAAVLSDKAGYLASVELVKKNTAWLRSELERLAKRENFGLFEDIYDSKANFVFCKTEQAKQIYKHLLTRGIAVRCFDGHLRICAGTMEEMQLLIKELESWKNELTN